MHRIPWQYTRKWIYLLRNKRYNCLSAGTAAKSDIIGMTTGIVRLSQMTVRGTRKMWKQSKPKCVDLCVRGSKSYKAITVGRLNDLNPYSLKVLYAVEMLVNTGVPKRLLLGLTL